MEQIENTFRRSLGGLADWPLLDMLSMLMGSKQHSPDVERQRSTMILARVHLISLAFGLLTFLWIVVDAFTFDEMVWQPIALSRIAASTGFFALAIFTRGIKSIMQARIAVGLMFVIPMSFYAITYPLLAGVETSGWSQSVFTGYMLLPFVIAGGLGFLPITLAEGLFCVVPLLLANYGVQVFLAPTLDFYSLLGVGWLLLLMSLAATFAGMSQLQLIIELAKQASADPLTKAFVRRVGQELLDAQFNVSERQAGPFSIAFADIDDFKSVNDQFGHDVGDKVLCQTTEHIQENLRKSDLLVRWGGEEFLLIMPNTDHVGAAHVIGRLYENGLGLRPDGSFLTVSIGVAERQADNSQTWEDLVAIADSRMYEAKTAGKNRFVGISDKTE
ncbi:MAG: GGDEF domain-containing protein [Alphaproteobacteria bacterium]|nr:GGDEF domain-containing protein [Alphaproteobacteria bacterium]MBT4016824.1 GGDEF domain-containing protein [Alphaproteobacteria bacterium]MBT5161016.1 GGDEF domain-containing protein [Alphaproteobacteria bacterium]MBT5919493.1 GGDEF domain-containing protein [Alphaproteobacteria bacterium]MBT6386012.1 GGDEF domain-containing protein [Alphaproteobacteria bacterium]